MISQKNSQESSHGFSLDTMIHLLKSIAERTRLRILALLAKTDLTVSDMTLILDQSQPRVSRHLGLLQKTALIQRYQEGAWAYFHLSEDQISRTMISFLLTQLLDNDPILLQDLQQLQAIKEQRQKQAAAYFSANAIKWDSLRLLHASDQMIDAALLQQLSGRIFSSLLDIGTGTGSMLRLLAPYYHRAIGIDNNKEMLTIARAQLEKANIHHASIRQADILTLTEDYKDFDLVIMHQFLHFLDHPLSAIQNAARTLCPGGTLVIVDFAPHNLESLHLHYAHRHPGFSDEQIQSWCHCAKLQLTSHQEVRSNNRNHAEQLTVKLWIAERPILQ